MSKILVCSECERNEVKVDDDSEQTVCWVCIVKRIGWDKNTMKQLEKAEDNLRQMGYLT